MQVEINATTGVEEKVDLEKGFGEYIFEASAEPYAAIACSSVMITWVSPTEGNLKSCQAAGKGNLTISSSFKSHLFVQSF